jgi:3-phenylpropionate/trans-cinnamate dioxygenase ferredoxin subunit
VSATTGTRSSSGCTHAECPLSDGWVEERAIRCACHGALFDLVTGEPLEGPAEEPVRVFATRVSGGRVEIDLGQTFGSDPLER